MKHTILILSFVFSLATAARADETLPPTLMTERGRLLLREDFAEPVAKAAMPAPATKGAAKKAGKTAAKAAPAPWTSGWRLRPGRWEFVDGAMKGTELKEDKHGAVARHPLPFRDVVIQYEVRLDGCRQTTFSVNDAKEHVCRVLIGKTGFKAQKDDHDHDGPDKAKPFNNVAMPIQPGVWHTVLIEIRGEEMVATINGRSSYGSDPLIATEKANFGFTVAGDGASVRRLRVWEGNANSAWEKTRAALTLAGR